MALADAILVCLTEKPMTGYELARSFDTSIGFFWRADHQQIYRELVRLRERGHAMPEEIAGEGKPNKLVYTITPQGRSDLHAWSSRPSAPPTIKDDLLVRLYALDHVDKAALRADIGVRLEHHRDRLARFERILAQRFAGRALSVRDTGRRLGLSLGLRYERSWVEWCEEALSALPADTPRAARSRIAAKKGAKE
jgi:DNA-binding PadR family transcriptional regulator